MKPALIPRLLLAAALLLALYFALLGGEYTFFDLRRAEADLETRHGEISRARSEVDSLNARIQTLQHDDAALERIARERYGFIRDGETLYRIAEPDTALATEPDTALATEPDTAAITPPDTAPATPPR